MALDPDWRDHARDIIPGVIGSVAALPWLTGSPWRMASSLLGGIGAAYYGSPTVAAWLSWQQGVVGLLIGLFGMALAARIYEAIAAVPIARIVDKFLSRWGL